MDDHRNKQGHRPKTCGTCKHWGEPRTSGRLPKPGRARAVSSFRECAAVRYLGKHGEDEAEASSLSAIVIDAEDYFAQLCTQAHFGCVLHEDGDARPK